MVVNEANISADGNLRDFEKRLFYTLYALFL